MIYAGISSTRWILSPKKRKQFFSQFLLTTPKAPKIYSIRPNETKLKDGHKRVVFERTEWVISRIRNRILWFDGDHNDVDDASQYVIWSYRISVTRSITSYKFIISHQYVAHTSIEPMLEQQTRFIHERVLNIYERKKKKKKARQILFCFCFFYLTFECGVHLFGSSVFDSRFNASLFEIRNNNNNQPLSLSSSSSFLLTSFSVHSPNEIEFLGLGVNKHQIDKKYIYKEKTIM